MIGYVYVCMNITLCVCVCHIYIVYASCSCMIASSLKRHIPSYCALDRRSTETKSIRRLSAHNEGHHISLAAKNTAVLYELAAPSRH